VLVCDFDDGQGDGTTTKRQRRALRVYDNRFLPTDRRPDLYLDPDLEEGGEVACHISDREDALPFGARMIEAGRASNGNNNNSNSNSSSTAAVPSSSQEWLWEGKGQFLAILVPYHRGRHYARNIRDFKPILKHLKRLHENGCVHGDVRGFNMAIVDEREGRLIDLDYGGRVRREDDPDDRKALGNYPRYPEGYKADLPDGFRVERKSGSPITARDDVFALAQFMFTCFKISREGRNAGAHLVDLQEELAQHVEDAADGDTASVLTINDALSQFADEAGWDLVPTLRFRRDLEKFGYSIALANSDSSVDRSVATFPATGSPSKRE
jgi:hypothetical protein